MKAYEMSVCGKTVRVEFLDPEVESIKDEDGGDDSVGEYREGVIKIVTKDKSEAELKSLLLHETIHAIFGQSNLWQHLQSLDDSVEELICANLESFLAPLIEFRDDAMTEVPVKKPRKRKKKGV